MATDARAVVVGAGPAGLFCANTLARGRYPGDVLVLEKGLKFEQRFISVEQWIFDPHAVLVGEGGAGFLADAKLCLSANAGAQFRAEVAREYERCLDDVDGYVYQALLNMKHEIRRSEPNRTQLRVVTKRLESAGLHLETYPVRPLGSDMAKEFLNHLIDDTARRGVRFRYGTTVKRVTQDGGGYDLLLTSADGEQVLHCDDLFLAVGWDGSSWLRDSGLPLTFEPNQLDLGVRLEFPSWGGEQLAEAGHNPKIKFRDSSSYAKTHCFVHKGRAFHFYLSGQCLVDAHAVRADPTSASSVNLLYRLHPDQLEKPLEPLRTIADVAGENTGGSPAFQDLPSFMGESWQRPSFDTADVFTPTHVKSCVETDIAGRLPPVAVAAIRQLLLRIAGYAPGVMSSDAIVYGPAAQWVMPKLVVSDYFGVEGFDGVWFIGDCTGLTAGVLPAAVSGLVAARDALLSPDARKQRRFWRFP